MQKKMQKKFLSTKEVAEFLQVNEKMVYSLVAEKSLPATKITGKWLFPQHLVEQWVETSTINYPKNPGAATLGQELLVICGSNDLLLDRVIAHFNTQYSEHTAVFGNLGSMGGLKALRRGVCHIAASHLLQENENGYNFEFAFKELERLPAVVNFCRREQGLLVTKGNPHRIHGVSELNQTKMRIVNRPLGTGTRLLFDLELKRAGIAGDKINGYRTECAKHVDVGLEVLSGRADAGPGIRTVAHLLGIGFVPLRWERYDLMVAKERFFDESIQRFFNLLSETALRKLAADYAGYDFSASGKMVFPEDR